MLSFNEFIELKDLYNQNTCIYYFYIKFNRIENKDQK